MRLWCFGVGVVGGWDAFKKVVMEKAEFISEKLGTELGRNASFLN